MSDDIPGRTGRVAEVTLTVRVHELAGDSEGDLIAEAIDHLDAGNNPHASDVAFTVGDGE